MNATATAQNLVVAIAIKNEKHKSSLDAVRWTLDNHVGRGYLIFLIHVRNKNPATKNEEAYKREIFNPFLLFCARKGVKCKDICLQGSNVGETIIGFISQNPVDVLIVGKNSTNTTSASADVSSTIYKGAPDFCTTFVISDGKPSSIKNATRKAPAASPLRAELQDHIQKRTRGNGRQIGLPNTSLPNHPPSGGLVSNIDSHRTLGDPRNGTGESPFSGGSMSGSRDARPTNNPMENSSNSISRMPSSSSSCSSSSLLQNNLNRFQQQQHKCQATLTSIATNRSASTSSALHHHGKPPCYPVGANKFSSNIEKLQQINTIRKSPAGAQMKRIIDLLFETRGVLTAEQINEACYVDVLGNKEVFDGLKNNPKVKFDGKRFSYKAKYDLKNKTHLLSLIRKFPEGLPTIDVKDAYPSVVDDLGDLKAQGQVWLLSSADSKEDVVYPNDPKVIVNVDKEIKLLFREIELPRDMLDVEKELSKNGMKPATNTAKRRAAAQITGLPQSTSSNAKKKRGISKRTKLTNAHLPELFQD